MNLEKRAARLVEDIGRAMGLDLDVAVETTAETLRLQLEGEGAEVLVRRKGEGLEAIQHIVSSAFRDELRGGRGIVVDALGFRRAREAELRETVRLLMERARATGDTQEIGPLNPYSRRLVHLAVAEDPSLSSESIGDAFLKKVLISPRHGS